MAAGEDVSEQAFDPSLRTNALFNTTPSPEAARPEYTPASKLKPTAAFYADLQQEDTPGDVLHSPLSAPLLEGLGVQNTGKPGQRYALEENRAAEQRRVQCLSGVMHGTMSPEILGFTEQENADSTTAPGDVLAAAAPVSILRRSHLPRPSPLSR